MPDNFLALASPLLLLEVVMKIVALTRLARAAQVRGGKKWVWAVLIVCVSLVGWLAFLLIGQPEPRET